MSVLDVYSAYNVGYQTEGHKHCRPGWANTPCPFCTGHEGFHLGVNLETWHYYCWRCGWKPTSKALAALTGTSEQKAKELIRQYRGPTAGRSLAREYNQRVNRKVVVHPYKHPTHCGHLTAQNRRYLERRGFDPEKLAREWGLLGTGPVSQLDGIDYRFRIVAPIYWEEEEVSFQTRDSTGKADLKYLACPKRRERIHHKHVLYGQPSAWDGIGICVEGITDVWRLGPKSFALFGIQFKTEQILHISNRFRRVVLLFDNDSQARKQAKLLAARLRAGGTSVHLEILPEGDPGDLTQDDADHLAKQLTKELC